MMNGTEWKKVNELVNLINQQYQYDFASYSKKTLIKQINKHKSRVASSSTFSEYTQHLLQNKADFLSLLSLLSINTTTMFREPTMFKALRDKVLPRLASFPNIRIWSAGCSSGEEAYSLALICHELGLLKRTQIYATDFNPEVINTSIKKGIHLQKLPEYTQNYRLSGGLESFAQYFDTTPRRAYFQSRFQDKITFSVHHLLRDSSFNQFHLILCRNVLIYYESHAQQQILELLQNSLVPFGYLCLGSSEKGMVNPSIAGKNTSELTQHNIFKYIL
jgi:chemotaxis protein methyltransferase CheR